MVLLGFLMIRDFTLYEIKKAMKRSVSFFYSGSFGSLHPALTRLEKNGLIDSKRSNLNGRSKKIYSITERGRKEHLKWLESDISMGRYQDEALLRLFFIHPMPAPKQITVIEKYINVLKKTLKDLEEILEESRRAESSLLNQKGFKFRMISGEYGIEHLKLEIKFYKNIVKKIQTGEFK